MKRFLFSSLFLSMTLSLAPSPAWAKPSDLPANNQIQCPDCGEETPHGSITIGLDVFTGRLSVQVEFAKPEPAAPMAIDTVTPACVEQLLKLAGELLVRAAGSRSVEPVATEPERQARRIFQVAESCRRGGDLSTARAFYQQVHMLTPTSRLGRLAIDRLVQIEERMRDDGESSDEPKPQEAFRSIPLGLVEISY